MSSYRGRGAHAKLLSKRDVAMEYGIPAATQEDLHAKGRFCDWLKIGSKIYYRREELEAWLDSQRVVTTHNGAETVEAPMPDEAMNTAQHDESFRAGGQEAKARAGELTADG